MLQSNPLSDFAEAGLVVRLQQPELGGATVQ